METLLNQLDNNFEKKTNKKVTNLQKQQKTFELH